MRVYRGTTIIEFLIYLTLFSFIMICSMGWIAQSYSLWHQYHIKRTALINQSTIVDMIRRDLQSASSNPIEWYLFEPHAIIWHTKKADLGWQWHEKTVRRYEGRYNKEQKAWKTKNSTIVAKPIDSLRFTRSDNQLIVIEFANGGRATKTMIKAPKGPLPWKVPKKGLRS